MYTVPVLHTAIISTVFSSLSPPVIVFITLIITNSFHLPEFSYQHCPSKGSFLVLTDFCISVWLNLVGMAFNGSIVSTIRLIIKAVIFSVIFVISEAGKSVYVKSSKNTFFNILIRQFVNIKFCADTVVHPMCLKRYSVLNIKSVMHLMHKNTNRLVKNRV